MIWPILLFMLIILLLYVVKTSEISFGIFWDMRWGTMFADEIMLKMPGLRYIEDWRESWDAAIVKYKREDYLLLKYLTKKEYDRNAAGSLLIFLTFLRKYLYRGSILVCLLSLSIPLSQYFRIPIFLYYSSLAIFVLLIGLTVQALALLFNNLKMGFINNFHLSVFSSREKNGIPIYRVSIRTILANFFRVWGRNFAALILGFAGIYSALFFARPEYFRTLSTTDYPLVKWLHMLYFSVITVSTTGYGDLGTTQVIPRMLFAYEIILGILYLIVLVIAFSHTIFPEKPDWILELRNRPAQNEVIRDHD